MLRLAMALVLMATVAEAQGTEAQGSDDIAALRGRSLYFAGDHAEAFAVLAPLAEAGQLRAQTVLGAMYLRGQGVPADPAMAVELWTKAADRSYPQALYNLYLAHVRGVGGVARDPERARAFLERAAELDFGPALGELGDLYFYGLDVAKDLEAAALLYERGAALGDRNSAARLGYMYATGDGKPQDFEQGRRLYRIAAAMGLNWAMRDYGEMLELGEGGDADPVEAFEWYRAAALADYPMAGMDIMELAEAHPGLVGGPVEVLAWCFLTDAQLAEQGLTGNAGRCDALGASLGQAEIEAARARAAEFGGT